MALLAGGFAIMTWGNATSYWTEAKIEKLGNLYKAKLSMSEIAAELGGISRNAVIGKCHRLGFERRGKTAAGNNHQKAPRKRRPSDSRHYKPPASFFVPIECEVIELADAATNPVTFAELQSDHCRWPIGEPTSPDFRFCGGNRHQEGNRTLPYCARHCRLAYQRPAKISEQERAARSYRARKRNKETVASEIKTVAA